MKFSKVEELSRGIVMTAPPFDLLERRLLSSLSPHRRIMRAGTLANPGATMQPPVQRASALRCRFDR